MGGFGQGDLIGPGDLKIKTAAGKPPLHLIPLCALTGVARVREYGDAKYAPGNYLLADATTETRGRYIGAALRHLTALQLLGGSLYQVSATDDESGLPHLDHAITSLIMLRHIMTHYGMMDQDPGLGKTPPRVK